MCNFAQNQLNLHKYLLINLLLAKIIYDKILDKYLTNEQEIHKNKLEDNEIIQQKLERQ